MAGAPGRPPPQSPSDTTPAVAAAAAANVDGGQNSTGVTSKGFAVQFLCSDNKKDNHTWYYIKVFAPDASCWYIHRRYSQVRHLHEQMRVWYGEVLPVIPPKRIIWNWEARFLKRRMAGLQLYMDGVLTIDAQASHPALRLFLQGPQAHHRETSWHVAGNADATNESSRQRARSCGCSCGRAGSSSTPGPPESQPYVTPPMRTQVRSAEDGGGSSQRSRPRANTFDGGSRRSSTSSTGSSSDKIYRNRMRNLCQEATASTPEGMIPDMTCKSIPPTPPDGGESWDWPLSRNERVHRIHLVDHKMAFLEFVENMCNEDDDDTEDDIDS